MREGRIGRRRLQPRLIRLARSDRLSHGVVDLKNQSLGAELTMRLLVVSADDGEGVKDVARVLPLKAVEAEEGGVKLSAQQRSSHRVEAEWASAPATVTGKCL